MIIPTSVTLGSVNSTTCGSWLNQDYPVKTGDLHLFSQPCRYCGMHHTDICYRIKEIEYYPNGTIKRVVLHGQ